MADDHIHISVLFQGVQPELVYNGMLQSDLLQTSDPLYTVSSEFISKDCYCHCARAISQTNFLTNNYLMECHNELVSRLQEKRPNSIFRILADYSSTLIRIVDREPLALQKNILELRERTLALGQDIFTCSALAAKDLQEGCVSNYFSWPSPIRMDHVEIQQMLEKGVSENHYHLYGSTRVFSVSWAFLMNHPEDISGYFKQSLFQENLFSRTHQGTQDNAFSWEERVRMAAWIRGYLFQRLKGGSTTIFVPSAGFGTGTPSADSPGAAALSPQKAFLLFCHSLNKSEQLKRSISIVQNQYGAPLSTRKGTFILDYAVSHEVHEHNSGPYRLLAGERNFLYHCFYNVFSGFWGTEEQNLLYLYLLIAFQFRNELVQSNTRKGFHNFAAYQNRKCAIWGDRTGYWEESLRLSIAADISRFPSADCLSLEMRVIPSRNSDDQLSNIQATDLSAAYALNRKEAAGPHSRHISLLDEMQHDCNYFYVMHFAKQPNPPLSPKEKYGQSIPPRNYAIRKDARLRATALMSAMQDSGYLCSRIRGIDACNHEIGCRPETFAVVFRYIRAFCCKPLQPQGARYWPLMNLTYHVGEDFLDLADGLRAIDEAICFLDMQHRDRLGHALALGIMPDHYCHLNEPQRLEPQRMPAQDLLDNLVWLLFRSLEWNVTMPSALRSNLSDRAERLLHDIYPFTQTRNISLHDYYNSWRLRGDDPSLYRRALVSECAVADDINALRRSIFCQPNSYLHALLDPHPRDYAGEGDTNGRGDGDPLRFNRDIQLLLYHYHFDPSTRLRGQKPTQFSPSKAYSDLIYDMQERMMDLISDKGIAIECNPSSNVLIGAFKGYENHPIFRFNHYGLNLPAFTRHHADLRVSVNTDDQGVFETSLESEYAALYACLSNWEDTGEAGALREDNIAQYLDHLRCMGNAMTFQKASCRKQSRFRVSDFSPSE